MNKFRAKGLKSTPQRMAVLEYLDGNTEHPSAEEIYNAVLEKYPTMSFSTVYNILETLKEHDMVQELTIDPHKKRFDPNCEHHHHLICTRCKTIVDIHEDFPLSIPSESKAGFEIIGNHIEFYGVCADCRNKKSETGGN